jgi:hypothetical protein
MNVYRNFRGIDPIVQLILLAGLIYGAVLLLPRIGFLNYGVNCENLASPLYGGNNQSILGRGLDPSELTLELLTDRTSINAGETLVLTVRFNNPSMAPIILPIDDAYSVFRYTGQEDGLTFAIQATNGQVLGEPLNNPPPLVNRNQYSNADLRMLSPRYRCNLRLEINGQRLANAGLRGGDYLIRAVYRSSSKGLIPAASSTNAPTPIFADYGVWVGEVRSNEILLRIIPGQ